MCVLQFDKKDKIASIYIKKSRTQLKTFKIIRKQNQLTFRRTKYVNKQLYRILYMHN